MIRTMLKSKIHRATITEANLTYEGSLTIDGRLMEMANILPYEMVYVYNINNGERFETYAIEEGEADSGVMCLNGAAARKGMPGDLIIITTFAGLSAAELEHQQPQVVHVDSKNRPKMPAPKKVLSL